MRICECGGSVRQHQLVRNREAWTCNACGRYEALEWYGQENSTCDIEPSENRDVLLDSKDQ
jgi:hypothetical protein